MCNFSLEPYAILLIVAVSIQATVIAYIYDPKWKALIFTLPIPFTFAALALGEPVDATNMLALVIYIPFAHGVRILHNKYRMKIVPSIFFATLLYCVLSCLLAGIIPKHDMAFWSACVITGVVGLVFYLIMPHKEEPGHRCPLPLYIKLPIVSAVIVFIVAIKGMLCGFMTIFPMIGLITAYEARHSLWTFCRHVPALMLIIGVMIIACRLLQPTLGLEKSLALSWVAFLIVFIPMMWRQWKSRDNKAIREQSYDSLAQS